MIRKLKKFFITDFDLVPFGAMLAIVLFTIFFIMALTTPCQAQTNGEAVLAWEINQFTGVQEQHILQRAEVISEIPHDRYEKRTIWVRTATDSLTFNITKSVMYSYEVDYPLVAIGKRKTVLILPKR